MMKWIFILFILLHFSFSSNIHRFFKNNDFWFNYDSNNERYFFIKRGLKVEIIPDNKFFKINDRIYRLKKMPKTIDGHLNFSSEDMVFVKKIINIFLSNLDVNVSELNEISYSDLKIPSFVLSKKSKRIDYIYIDPGHGGKDVGANAYGLEEKTLTLQFSKELAKKMKGLFPSKKILLTRESDVYVDLPDRSRMANKNLSTKVNSIFISVHFNSWFNPNTRGLEVYYLSHDNSSQNARIRSLVTRENFSIYKNSIIQLKILEKIFGRINIIQYQKESKFIADGILKKVKSFVLDYPVNRGLKSDLFYVLKGTLMPAVLIEVGFISNRKDMEFIHDDKKRDRLVTAISIGIKDYIKIFDKTKGLLKDNFILK